MTDLWPTDLATVTRKPPGTILKEQAALLGMKTKNVVNASVRQAGVDEIPGKLFSFSFLITAPVLGNYTYRLFIIYYDIDLYPVQFIVDDAIAREIGVDQDSGQQLIAAHEEEFIEILSRILGSQKTRQVIRGILSHATGQNLGDNGAPG